MATRHESSGLPLSSVMAGGGSERFAAWSLCIAKPISFKLFLRNYHNCQLPVVIT